MSAFAAGGEPDAPLFIYGSLMAEEVLRALIERTPTCQPGTITGLHRPTCTSASHLAPATPPPKQRAAGDRAGPRRAGFHRYCVAGQPYPAVAPRDDGRVAGLVLRGLSAQEHAVLDWFEDEEYSKVEVRAPAAAAPRRAGSAALPAACSKAKRGGGWFPQVEVSLAAAPHEIAAPGCARAPLRPRARARAPLRAGRAPAVPALSLLQPRPELGVRPSTTPASETCPVSREGGTRRVQSVGKEGRDVSS
jgi:gamma-glutamylcyclotransferase (GGCT)/AIG2-like uncharacterized protein YtfP